MKSILFISLMNGASWGGSEELWYRSALYIAGRNYKVACCMYYWEENSERISALKAAGIEVYLVPNEGRKKKDFLQKLRYEWITKLSQANYVKKLPVNNYETIVVNQGGYSDVCSSPWKNFFKRLPYYALVFHNYHERMSLTEKKKKNLSAWINHAAVNLFAAGRIKNVLEEHLSMAIPNGDVLYNPVTFQPPETIIPLPALVNGNYVFIMLAALDVMRKAQDNLVKVLSQPKWQNRNWLLYLYGEGKDRPLLKQLIADNNIQQKIFLKGRTNDAKSELEKSHLLLQVTHMDAMPLSVVEAMSVSRPLIVSRIGDMPGWVVEGQNGWIAEDASKENIDLTLEKAWQQRESWRKMGEASFHIFKQKYPSDVEENFINQVLNTVNRD